MNRGPWIDHFGDNFLWSNATLILKGMAPYGVVALEEIDRVCEKLRVRQNEPDAWRQEWRAMGELVERRADAALDQGHKITAGDYYLRAGIYHYNAERFISDGARPSPVVRLACGSRSTSSVERCCSAKHAPNAKAVVVLATPPF